MEFERYMRLAIEEAKESLREGNNGFGAVIVRNGEVVAAEHDREDTQRDPTSHAEINAIRAASRKLGKTLADCALIATHEPCPMCASAIVWAKIPTVAYGYSIRDAIGQGRKRVNVPCAEVFERAGARVETHAGVLEEACALLYRADVRKEIERLRDAGDDALEALNEDSVRRRTAWFAENRERFGFLSDDLPDSGYRLLLERFHITPDEAPVVSRDGNRIMFHSMNFCPTLEACKILGLDTRYVCKRLNENATDMLVRQIDPRLRFSRNYEKLRPYSAYCEEMITLLSE